MKWYLTTITAVHLKLKAIDIRYFDDTNRYEDLT